MNARHVLTAAALLSALTACGTSSAEDQPAAAPSSPTTQALSVKDRDACGTYTMAATQAVQTVLAAGRTGTASVNQAITYEAQRMREAAIRATDAGLAADMKDSATELAKLQVSPTSTVLPDPSTFRALTTEVLDRCR